MTMDVESDKELSIRQMREAFQVTLRALRFYETKELLSPRRVGQHRLYGPRECARLTLILRAKRYGLSLKEIRMLLQLYSPADRGMRQLSAAREAVWVRRSALIVERDLADAKLAELDALIAQGEGLIAEEEGARAA